VKLPAPLNGTDITVKLPNGTAIPFCYETATGECTTDSAFTDGYIWIKVPYIGPKESIVLYLVPGTNGAVPGDQVFDFYDDFDNYVNGYLQSNDKWIVLSPSKAIISDGVLEIRGAVGCEVIMVSKESFKYVKNSIGLAVEWRERYYNEVANSGWDLFLPTQNPPIQKKNNKKPYYSDCVVSEGNYFLLSPFTTSGISKIWRHSITQPPPGLCTSNWDSNGWCIVATGSLGDKSDWHVFQDIIDSNFNLVLSQDGSVLVNYKEHYWNSLNGYLAWREGNHDIDWVRVRKLC
jgi:hypothetical protein